MPIQLKGKTSKTVYKIKMHIEKLITIRRNIVLRLMADNKYLFDICFVIRGTQLHW